MKLLHVATLISIAFLFLSCKKKSLTETTQPEEPFSCLVNGKKWVPNGSHGFFVGIPSLSGVLKKDGNGQFCFDLMARKDPSLISNEPDSYDDIFLEASAPLHLGEYVFNSSCLACSAYCQYDRLSFRTSGIYRKCFSTNSEYTGKINFTRIDTVQKIITGTFESTAISATGEVIQITDGKFDIKS
jgi:hypothetical protein